MPRKTTTAHAAKRPKKPKQQPLTARVHKAMQAHGAGTADAIARRVKVKSRPVSKALFSLKLRGLADWVRSRIGEAVWRAKGKRS